MSARVDSISVCTTMISIASGRGNSKRTPDAALVSCSGATDDFQRMFGFAGFP